MALYPTVLLTARLAPRQGSLVINSGKYDEVASELQRGVKYDELEHLDKRLDDYSEAQVRPAIVHTRQDHVLLVSYLASLNRQVATVRWLL